MADFQTTVELKAQTQHLDRALKNTTKQIDGVKKEVMKTQGAFKKFGENASKSIAKVDAAFAKHKGAIAGVFAAISGAILKGTSDLKKWEDGLTQIETLGVKGMKKVEQQLISVRKTYGVTGKEATKGYYDIISAGAKEGIEAQEQLNAAIKLAKAGNTDLTKAVDILTSGLNVWKKEGVTATEVTDKLFLAVKYGKTTVAELGATFGRVAPLSQAAGASIDDYATSMAVLTANGFKTEDATTGLKGAFGGMLKVTDGASKAAKSLGIEWESAGTTWGTSAIQAEGFENVLLKLNTALATQAKAQGLNTAQAKAYRAATITKLFEDKTAAASILTLTGNIDKFSSILKDMGNSAGTTAEAYKKTQKDLSFHLGKFNQSLAVLSETIGKNFKPALLSIVKVITPVIDAFQTLVKENPGLIASAAAIAAVATSMAFFGTFKTGIFGAIIGGVILLSKHFSKFADNGTEAIHKIQVVWNDWWRGFSDNTYVKGVAATLNKISAIFGDIHLPSIDFGSIFSGDFDLTLEQLSAFWLEIEQSFDDVAAALLEVDWIKGIYTPIAKAIDWVTTKIKEFGTWLIFGSYWTEMLDEVTKVTEGWNIGKIFDEVINSIKKSFTDAKNALGAGLAIGAVTITDTSAISYWDNLKASMSNYMDTLTTKSKTAAKALATFESSAGLQKAASGLLLVKEAAQDTGTSVLKSASSWAKSTLEVGKQKRALQKLIQTQREIQASFIQYADLSTATDAKTTLALENSSKVRNTFINERIAKYRTLGREIAKIKESQVGAEISKGVDALGDKLKGRGFISRFVFGEGTLLTWEQKMQGLFGRLGTLFSKLGGGIQNVAKSIETSFATASQKAATLANQTALLRDTQAAKGVTDRAVAQAKVAPATKGTFDKAGLKALQESSKRQGKLIQAIQKAIVATNTNFSASAITLEKIKTGSTGLQKTLKVIGVTLGGLGTILRASTEGLTAAIPKIKSAFSTMSKFAGISATMGAVAKVAQPALNILKKVAVPLIAVFGAIDAYKGFTDLELAAKILGKSEGFDVSTLSTFDKSIAAVSNAFGKFFDGFADLAGSAITYLGGDVLGKMLKDVELAPEFAKIFTIIGNLFDTIINIGRAIASVFSGDKGESSVLTDLLVGLGKFLSWLLTFLVNTTAAIAHLTSGDLGKAFGAFSSSFTSLFDFITVGIEKIRAYASNLLNKLTFGFAGTAAPTQDAAPADTPPVQNKTVNRRGRKDGGIVGYAAGGDVMGPGTGRSDSIPALLSNGEFVVNAKSASMFRPLLEMLNANKFANGGSVGDAKSRQYLQFSGEGKGSLDVEKTMKMFINNLDATNPKVKQVVQKMQWLANATKNSTAEEIKNEAYTRDINNLLNNLVNPETKKLAEVAKEASGAVLDLGEAADEAKNAWAGMSKELTGPIKNAFLEGGSIGDAIKEGMHGLLKGVASKLMDRAFKPLEDMLDNTLNDLFGSGDIELGSSVANPMITQDANASGVLAGVSPAQSLVGSFNDEDSQFAMLAEQNAAFAEMGEMTQRDMLFEQMEGFGGVTDSIFDQTGSMGGMFDGLGGLFSQGLEGLGGFLSNMGGGSGGGGGFDLFGMIGSIFMAKGGIVPKPGQKPLYFGDGGFVPKGSDTVPAMLTPGEMVLNKDQQGMLGGGSTTYNTYNLDISGNVDERAISQIRNIIQNSPNQVNQASQRGERERTGLRPSNRR